MKLIKESQTYAKKLNLPIPEWTLLPRFGAFSLALQELKPSLDVVYDITIGYGQSR